MFATRLRTKDAIFAAVFIHNLLAMSHHHTEEHTHHQMHDASCEHEHNHEHHHGHEHHHEHSDTRHQLMIIIVAALLLIVAVIIEKTCHLSTWQLLLVYLVPYLIAGFGTLKEAAEGIAHGDVFNEDFLMSIATIGALSIGFFPGAESQFPEAVFVMLFFQIGELFEHYAEGKSRDSIAHLMDLRPDTVRVLRDGVAQLVTPEQVGVGEQIEIHPGERVPIDAVIEEGHTTLNTSALTGESMPVEAEIGDEVLSGSVNISGLLRCRTTKSFGESTVSKIIHLVEDANEHKSRSETFITRFAHVYTPIVVGLAVALAIIPPLVMAFSEHSFQMALFGAQFPTWFYRALMFLVISCPCALVLSVPLSFFGGIGGASRHGVLVKGANFIDVLAKTDTVVFDKTGTLTEGRFQVVAVHPDQYDEHQLLHLAAHVEHFSTHPIGAALRDAFPNEATDGCQVSDVEEIAGQGICAKVGENKVCVGNGKLMDAIGVSWHDCGETGTIVHVAVDGIYVGHVVISDVIREDSAVAVSNLRSLGVQRLVMLTGDREASAEEVARTLGLDEWHAQLLPGEKLQEVERLKEADGSSTVAFVGDGINDAPVLARADVGIAMGGLGSDAAIDAADVVLMDDHPSKIALAVRIARKTVRIARQNVIFAIGVKVLVLVLAALGIATMWMAVFADVGVTVIAVLNAMRTLKMNY